MINAVIYARTSPDCAVSAEDQIDGLKAVADQNGWTLIKIFSDHPLPMKKGKERRPAEDALLEMVKAGGVQRVLLWSIDRVGRSLVKLVGIMEMCRTGGVGLYLHDRKLDTSSSNGLGLFDLGEMLAFHLRQGRRDKILRGQAAAREAAVRFGRPTIPVNKVEKAKRGLADGKGVREVARLAGMSPASVSRLKSRCQEDQPSAASS